MTDDMTPNEYTPEPMMDGGGEDKKNNTPLIIGIVVAVLLCCCCSIIALLWFYGDTILFELGLSQVPALLNTLL